MIPGSAHVAYMADIGVIYNLPQQQHVLSSDKEESAIDIRIEIFHVEALNGVLKDEIP